MWRWWRWLWRSWPIHRLFGCWGRVLQDELGIYFECDTCHVRSYILWSEVKRATRDDISNSIYARRRRR
jgi:hypothetical protein